MRCSADGMPVSLSKSIARLLASAALLLTSQSLEALRVMAEGFNDARVQIASAEFGALVLAVLLWYSARVSLYAIAPDAATDSRDIRRLSARYLPRIYGVLPLLSLSLAAALSFLPPSARNSASISSGDCISLAR